MAVCLPGADLRIEVEIKVEAAAGSLLRQRIELGVRKQPDTLCSQIDQGDEIGGRRLRNLPVERQRAPAAARLGTQVGLHLDRQRSIARGHKCHQVDPAVGRHGRGFDAVFQETILDQEFAAAADLGGRPSG